jgi:nucleoside-diphosphate-sugar epimerase
MRVGVTGATGFVGSRLVEDLAVRGFATRAISRRRAPDLPEGAEWAASPDLGGDADWTGAVEGLDVLVHAAARVHVMHETDADPLAAFRRANVEGTVRLARQAAAAGCRRFVFISSIKVNGEGAAAGRPYRADDTPQPVDPYGISKLEAERALFQLSAETGMEVVVIRPTLVYGAGVKANFRAIMAAVAKGMPMPFGLVDNARSMVFVGNLSDLVLRALEHPAALGQIFLASDGQDLSTAELIRGLGEALGRRARLLPVPPALLRLAATSVGKRAVAQRLLGSLAVDIEPTRTALGWEPPFTVAQGLAETAAAFLRGRDADAE